MNSMAKIAKTAIRGNWIGFIFLLGGTDSLNVFGYMSGLPRAFWGLIDAYFISNHILELTSIAAASVLVSNIFYIIISNNVKFQLRRISIVLRSARSVNVGNNEVNRFSNLLLDLARGVTINIKRTLRPVFIRLLSQISGLFMFSMIYFGYNFWMRFFIISIIFSILVSQISARVFLNRGVTELFNPAGSTISTSRFVSAYVSCAVIILPSMGYFSGYIKIESNKYRFIVFENDASNDISSISAATSNGIILHRPRDDNFIFISYNQLSHIVVSE